MRFAVGSKQVASLLLTQFNRLGGSSLPEACFGGLKVAPLSFLLNLPRSGPPERGYFPELSMAKPNPTRRSVWRSASKHSDGKRRVDWLGAALFLTWLSGAIVLSALTQPAFAREVAVSTASTPADIYGPLFHQVQTRRIFEDSKTFVDAVPKRSSSSIMAEYLSRDTLSDAELKQFVLDNFALPDDAHAKVPSLETRRASLKRHISSLWPHLTRKPVVPRPGGSELQMAKPFVVPGGRFREIYYWDSYFTMLGLQVDGRDDLVENMIDDFGDLIARYGHVPNGARTYYLSRSQPPFFFAMVGLSKARDEETLRRRLMQMRREHAFWMDGASALKPGEAFRRAVRMPNGEILNRYFDDRATPREESYREDIETAALSGRPPETVYRDLRAGAESGWDYSSRWLKDGKTLSSIQTTEVIPVDLNSLLFGLERTIADTCTALGESECSATYAHQAKRRARAMDLYLWDQRRQAYLDYQWHLGQRINRLSSATLYPLFVGLSSQLQAKLVAETVNYELLATGGVRTTKLETGQQWDMPNGWAPLQWIAVSGLRRYGDHSLAGVIASRWIKTVEREYCISGRLLEKYDLEKIQPGGGGEYPTQDGFGWTNGVTQKLLSMGYFSPLARTPCF